MRPASTRLDRRTLALLALPLLAACGGGGDGGAAPAVTQPTRAVVALEIVSGTGQGGAPAEPLAEPLVVRVTRDGQPAAGVSVAFQASAGQLDADARTTDAAGRAEVRWTLPADGGAIAGARVTAQVAGSAAPAVTFAARRLRDDEMDLVLADPGTTVRLLAYRAGAFRLDAYDRRAFTDSLQLRYADPAARDELVAFTAGRAPLLVPVAWTARRDTVRLRFAREVIRVPMTIWVVQPPFDSTAKLVAMHLQGVRDSWEAQAGIGLRDVRIVDATRLPGVSRYQGTGITACDASIRTVVGFDQGRLNAYYIGQPNVGSAGYCGEGWMQVFPLAWERQAVVLAHEIGHGLLGGHHETIPDNVMHFRGEGATFSAGQMFRAHYSESSVLNTMFQAHPQALRRPCATDPSSAAPRCPPTSFVLD